MADLCDKQTDPAITEACRQHMKECAACRAYYEDFMHTVNLLTPKHAPSFGKTQPAVSISPLQATAKPKKHPSHKWIQIAAAVAIFMAGLGTGLSNFFSTQAEAVPSIPLIFDQSIKSSRSAASFSMSVYARTTPNENFAYHQSGIRLHENQPGILAPKPKDILAVGKRRRTHHRFRRRETIHVDHRRPCRMW